MQEKALDASQFSRHVYLAPEEKGFVAVTPEFPHLSAYAETPEAALTELTILIEDALEVHVAEGWPVPEPQLAPPPMELPSGRFVLRLPRTLHARLADQARLEGVSINTLAIMLIAEGLADHRAAQAESRADGVSVK